MSKFERVLIRDCLLDWFAGDQSVERFRSLAFDVSDRQEQAIVIKSHGDSIEPSGTGRSSISIQTHAWKLIKKTSADGLSNGDQLELYAKPDDRWEVNDVSRRCPKIVEALETLLDQWLKTGSLGGHGRLKLEESLWNRVN